MYPPPDAIERLERLVPNARLGWIGWDDGTETDELNRGEFALLQLYRKVHVNQHQFGPWRGRGPVFGAGWDHDTHEPLWVESFSKQEVFDGSFINKVKRWITPLRRRLRESDHARARAYDAKISDLAEQQGDYLYWRSQKSQDKPKPVAKKHMTQREKDVLAGDYEKDSTKEFIRPLPAEGA